MTVTLMARVTTVCLHRNFSQLLAKTPKTHRNHTLPRECCTATAPHTHCQRSRTGLLEFHTC